MKKLVSLVVAIVMFLFVGMAVAGGGGKLVKEVKPKIAIKAGYDVIYEISLPYDVRDQRVTQEIEESSWFCDEDQNVEVKERYIRYSYVQRVSELTKYNVNTVNISGQTDFGRIENLDGFISFRPEDKTVLISIASRSCGQSVTQEFDSDRNKWVCRASSEYTCGDIYHYGTAGGNVILTVEPYLRVITVR